MFCSMLNEYNQLQTLRFLYKWKSCHSKESIANFLFSIAWEFVIDKKVMFITASFTSRFVLELTKGNSLIWLVYLLKTNTENCYYDLEFCINNAIYILYTGYSSKGICQFTYDVEIIFLIGFVIVCDWTCLTLYIF